jgi:hypothetical protein
MSSRYRTLEQPSHLSDHFIEPIALLHHVVDVAAQPPAVIFG